MRTLKAGRFPFTCPICGRKTDYPVTELVEGAKLTCPFCKFRLTLHGHMLEDVQKEIKRLKMNMVRKKFLQKKDVRGLLIESNATGSDEVDIYQASKHHRQPRLFLCK